MPQRMLAALDAHISNCLSCSRSLAEAAAASERWERRGWLGRLVRVEAPVAVPFEATREESAARAA